MTKVGKKLDISKIFPEGEKLKLPKVKGFDINKVKDVKDFVEQLRYVGFQASNVARATRIIREMKRNKALTILTFTSNMVSCGLRELFAELCKRKFIDIIITGVGSIEEDVMKCFTDFYLGSFDVDDKALHKKGINRIGDIFVPNEAYIKLEEFLMPFFKEMYKLQKERSRAIAPSEFIFELGKRIKDKRSILYWCSRNRIPIYCPAITDGALGLQLYFFKQECRDFQIDVTGDMNDLAERIWSAKKTGGIILGGGFAKHHAIGINIVRGGFDYCVYITTAQEYDGSLSGARSNEGISWGKISVKANHVTLYGDASILFPLVITPVLK